MALRPKFTNTNKGDVFFTLQALGHGHWTAVLVTYPDMLHILPAADHAVLHGIVDLQHGAQLARVVTHHQVLHLRIIEPSAPVFVIRNNFFTYLDQNLSTDPDADVNFNFFLTRKNENFYASLFKKTVCDNCFLLLT